MVIKLDPKNAGAYSSRGYAFGKLGNYQQAIRDLDRVIELNPQYATAYYNRGVTHWGLGNHRQAREDLKIAARLGNKGAQDFLKSKGVSW
jgi:tetratricopeptide (TPR) repeat protein